MGNAVQSVDRAAAVLDLLADHGEAGVSEVGAALEVHKSTASRLLASLERHGLVEQASERGRYRLGLGILRLAAATTARLDVVQVARPSARALAAQTGETVNVAVLNDGAALYLDQVTGTSVVQPHNWVGQRIPLHATSNGRVLLSGLAPADVLAAAGELVPYTPATVTDPEKLLVEVAQVREDGRSVVVDELEHGLTAVAAPVHDVHGDVVASMSVSGPTFRFDERQVRLATDAVVAATADVSRRLGHRDQTPDRPVPRSSR